MKHKTFLNWSGGKDAMFALHQSLGNSPYQVDRLLTTFSQETQRVSMHGVSLELMQAQAEAMGLELDTLFLEAGISLEAYNRQMEQKLNQLKEAGYTHSVFGDILLEDLKEYREQQLKKVAITPVFPLWKKDTLTLAKEFIAAGYQAIIVSVNEKVLDKSFCGRILDYDFLNDLPSGVDPCGENGEYHSFVFDGPLFKNPVSFELAEVIEKQYQPNQKEDEKDCYKEEVQSWDTKFWFADLQSV